MTTRTLRRLVSSSALVLLLAACGLPLAVVRHDETRAAAEAVQVLGLVYVAHDYGRAHARLHPGVRDGGELPDLGRLVANLEARRGSLQEVERDSFLPAPGERTMVVFFRAVHERGPTYHRVTLLGDAEGYRVSELAVQLEPYAPEPRRQPYPPAPPLR
jgi:hypothetical protein